MLRLFVSGLVVLMIAFGGSTAAAQGLTRADCDQVAETLRDMAVVTARHRVMLTAYGTTGLDREMARAERMMALYRELMDSYADMGCGRILPIPRD